jgi:hypothetical protein
MNKILTIGDSHTSVFSGLSRMTDCYPYTHNNDPFIACRLGPCTAYKLWSRSDEILQICHDVEIGPNDKILIAAGEIDCRYHIPYKWSLTPQILLQDFIEKTVDALLETVWNLLTEYKRDQVITYSCPGTSWFTPEEFPTEFPRIGDEQYRNNITRRYNSYLKSQSIKYEIPNLDLTNYLIDENNFTQRQYYMDKIHLDGKIMMPIIKKELNL